MELDTEGLLKRYRKKPLCSAADLGNRVSLERPQIEQLIPHRDPLMLLDLIEAIDFEQECIVGRRRIPEDDPVFRGHFPGAPIYPGPFQLEMLGQLGIALCSLLKIGNCRIPPDMKPPDVRATKILGAHFLAPILPGQVAIIMGKRIEWDGIISRFIGQIMVEDTVCCAVIGDICFLT